MQRDEACCCVSARGKPRMHVALRRQRLVQDEQGMYYLWTVTLKCSAGTQQEAAELLRDASCQLLHLSLHRPQ